MKIQVFILSLSLSHHRLMSTEASDSDSTRAAAMEVLPNMEAMATLVLKDYGTPEVSFYTYIYGLIITYVDTPPRSNLIN